jgi:UDP-3-O-[3-hydroxymyristoyl] N-acetylglucosamine deacetylase
MQQTTIRRRVQCAGIGLHSGESVRLVLRPAAVDTGILFHAKTAGRARTIIPCPEAVDASGLASTLVRDGVSVGTVEHLLAALRGLGIDNIHVDIEGGEAPILDGSAAPFADLLEEAGLWPQGAPRRVFRLTRPFSLARGGKSITAVPGPGFLVDYSIDFPRTCIGRQRLVLDLTPETFRQVAGARTFGFAREVEALRARGLARGGSLDNAVVLNDEGVLNPEGLRAPDEFVRHKILDFIGDMAVLPFPLTGRFTVVCSGHSLNNEFLRLALRERAVAPSAQAVSASGRRLPSPPLLPVPACAG